MFFLCCEVNAILCSRALTIKWRHLFRAKFTHPLPLTTPALALPCLQPCNICENNFGESLRSACHTFKPHNSAASLSSRVFPGLGGGGSFGRTLSSDLWRRRKVCLRVLGSFDDAYSDNAAAVEPENEDSA